MRRFVLTYILLAIIGTLGLKAQNTLTPVNSGTTMRDQYGNQVDPSTQPDNLTDSTSTQIESLPPKLYMWHLSEKLGDRTIVPVDTVTLNFQNTNLVEGMNGHYNYLGNLGSPRMSRLFFERGQEEAPTIFIEPFSSFFFRPDQLNFTNSNIPYSNLTYYKAGSKINGEERFKSYFRSTPTNGWLSDSISTICMAAATTPTSLQPISMQDFSPVTSARSISCRLCTITSS